MEDQKLFFGVIASLKKLAKLYLQYPYISLDEVWLFPLFCLEPWSFEVILFFFQICEIKYSAHQAVSPLHCWSLPPLRRLLLPCRNLHFYLFPLHIFSCHTVSPSSSAICSSELLKLYCSKSTFHLFFTYSYLTLAIHFQFFEDVYLAVVVQAVRGGLVFLNCFFPRSSWNLVCRKSHSHSCFPVRVYEETCVPPSWESWCGFPLSTDQTTMLQKDFFSLFLTTKSCQFSSVAVKA